MTQEIINTLHMLINENDPDMRTHYAVAINNHILELENIIAKLEAPKTCEGCSFYISRYTPKGQVAYKYCTAEVNKASSNFSCSKYQPRDSQ